MKWSTSPHRPPHLYLDGAWYFITASTVNKAHILKTDQHLDLWVQMLNEVVAEFGIRMAAWAVMPNHYHLLFLPKLGADLARLMQRLNGRSSRGLNLLDLAQGRSIWYSYWDTCIRDERGFWTRSNYIHYNPVKHGYAAQPEDWQFSSYRFYLDEQGREWLARCWTEYPSTKLLEDDTY
jgi:putative transposase